MMKGRKFVLPHPIMEEKWARVGMNYPAAIIVPKCHMAKRAIRSSGAKK